MNKKLIQWFIGFCDAEGCFQILKTHNSRNNSVKLSYAFYLSLHIREKLLLTNLINDLSLPGKLYIYEHRNEIRLNVIKLNDLNFLINEIFVHFPLLNKKQLMRFSKLKEGIMNDIKSLPSLEKFNEYYNNGYIDPIMQKKLETLNIHENEFGNWLNGFITGEGCFSIKKIPDKKGEKIYYVKEFCMEQTDLFVMELIKDKFNFSPQIIVKNRPNRPNSKTTYEIRISSKKDIEKHPPEAGVFGGAKHPLKLITFIESKENISLLGNKLDQYKIWKNKE